MLLRELPHGNAIVIDVLVGTFVGDTGAYLGGRTFGRRPLAPRISPNKTVEGLAIGMLAAIARRRGSPGLYQDWLSATDALAARPRRRDRRARSATCSSRSSSATSARRTPAALFGAHGGALDRLDAALFAAVVGYYVWYALA